MLMNQEGPAITQPSSVLNQVKPCSIIRITTFPDPFNQGFLYCWPLYQWHGHEETHSPTHFIQLNKQLLIIAYNPADTSKDENPDFSHKAHPFTTNSFFTYKTHDFWNAGYFKWSFIPFFSFPFFFPLYFFSFHVSFLFPSKYSCPLLCLALYQSYLSLNVLAFYLCM